MPKTAAIANAITAPAAENIAAALAKRLPTANAIGVAIQTRLPTTEAIANSIHVPPAETIAKKIPMPTAETIAQYIPMPPAANIAKNVPMPSAALIGQKIEKRMPTAVAIKQAIQQAIRQAIPSADDIATKLVVPDADEITEKTVQKLRRNMPSARALANAFIERNKFNLPDINTIQQQIIALVKSEFPELPDKKNFITLVMRAILDRLAIPSSEEWDKFRKSLSKTSLVDKDGTSSDGEPVKKRKRTKRKHKKLPLKDKRYNAASLVDGTVYSDESNDSDYTPSGEEQDAASMDEQPAATAAVAATTDDDEANDPNYVPPREVDRVRPKGSIALRSRPPKGVKPKDIPTTEESLNATSLVDQPAATADDDDDDDEANDPNYVPPREVDRVRPKGSIALRSRPPKGVKPKDIPTTEEPLGGLINSNFLDTYIASLLFKLYKEGYI